MTQYSRTKQRAGVASNTAYRVNYNARPTIAAWAMIGLFALAVALLGGSSRPDAVQIAALRPLSALFLIPALYLLTVEQVSRARFLVAILGVLAIWMALQLIPLSPSVWQSLPDRDIIADLDRMTGLEGMWRPLSLVPTRSYNALAAIIVPVSALVIALAARLRLADILMLIAMLGFADAVLGIAQVVTGQSSPLYYYASTNEGFPVGIFANENHSAVFSSLTLLVIARLGFDKPLFAEIRGQGQGVRILLAAVYLVVLFAVMISGSRFGILAALIAIASSAAMFYVFNQASNAATKRQRHTSPLQKWANRNQRKLTAGLIIIVAAPVVLIGMSENAPGVEGVFSESVLEDLRWQLWPTLQTMMATHWLFGTGFGSFEEVYHIYEPTALLLPVFVNHAHNDFAQLLIEGGLPAVALAAALLVWLLLGLLGIVRAGGAKRAIALFWATAIAIVIGASAIDYPLRIPAFQAITIWLLLGFTYETAVYRNSRAAEQIAPFAG